jgi:hypothetical protein
MSQASPSMYFKVMILSLGLSAVGCGLPSISGGQTDQDATVTGIPTSSPTATPIQSEEPPTAESPSATSGACSNTYLPVVQGATWSYDVTGGPNGTTSYTDTISALSGDSFTLTTSVQDLTRTQRWSCGADGLVALDFGGASATLAVANLQAEFDTTASTGVTLPADIAPGDTWSQTFTLEGSQTVSGDRPAKAEGQVEYDSTAAGLESVTVPAGTFEALRVDGTTSMDLTVHLSGFTVPMTISGTIVRWYAPGVGFIRSVEKSDVFGTELEVKTELTSYDIP